MRRHDPSLRAVAAALTLALGALAPVTARGAVQYEASPVWYHLTPPFADPDFKSFAFEPQKNPALALVEIVGINFGMWFVSYWAGNEFSKIGFDTIGQNFRKGWIIDTDPYWVNSLGHPIEGAMFYDAARSTGHSVYESFGFAFLGSLMWEEFMEKQSPSINDQITTPFGGSILGEVLYRMHRLVLDSGGASPSNWREFAAFLISPPAGFNRWTSGDRYRGEMLLPPSWIGEFQLGAVIGGSTTDNRTGATTTATGPWTKIGAHILYGVPGSPDLRLKQPFDHFDLAFSFAFAGAVEATGGLLIRALIVGDTIGSGGDFGGLWGLFGSYDVIGVPLFKATGAGFGPGVSLMNRWGWFELHGTALAEFMPWAGGGSMQALFARDYHYGVGANALLQLRGHFADRATLDLAIREYLISGSYATGQSEDVSYGRASLTVRVYGPHAVGVNVDWARRHASYPDTPDISQRSTVWAANYTLLQGW